MSKEAFEMIDFRLHSLSNFSDDQIQQWIHNGIVKIASITEIPVEQFEQLISMQNAEIKRRANYPTIDINTPERIALRQQIIQDYFECFQGTQKNKVAAVVLGQIASGKTSYCKQLMFDSHAFVVDVDYIKQGYQSMDGLRADFDEGKGTDQIHEEASMLSKQVLSMALNQGYNLIIPKTGISYNSIEKIVKSLKQKGYDVSMVYIDLPIEKCIERNYFRFADEITSGIPSRLIPFDAIKRIDDKPFLTFAKFLKEKDRGLVDNFIALSNDVEMGHPMQQIPLEDILSFYSQTKSHG